MKLVSTLAVLTLLAAPAARAEDFDFAFSTLASSSYSGGGYVPGTVTGELIGLSPDGTSAPTDVLLFSNPDHIPNGDLFALGWFNPLGPPGTFTVSNGVVTAYDYTILSNNTNQELSLGLPFNGVEYNLLINYILDDTTGNSAGLAGVSFTPADVPEPLSLLPFLAGVIFLLAQGWSRQKKTAMTLFRQHAIGFRK